MIKFNAHESWLDFGEKEKAKSRPAHYKFYYGSWSWINERGVPVPCPDCETPPKPPGGWNNRLAVYNINGGWFVPK